MMISDPDFGHVGATRIEDEVQTSGSGSIISGSPTLGLFGPALPPRPARRAPTPPPLSSDVSDVSSIESDLEDFMSCEPSVWSRLREALVCQWELMALFFTTLFPETTRILSLNLTYYKNRIQHYACEVPMTWRFVRYIQFKYFVIVDRFHLLRAGFQLFRVSRTFRSWPQRLFTIIKECYLFFVKSRLTTLFITTRAFIQNRLTLVEYALILIDQTQIARGKLTSVIGAILYTVVIILHSAFHNQYTSRLVRFAERKKYRPMIRFLNDFSRRHVIAQEETLLENILTNTQRSQLLETLSATMRAKFGTTIDFAKYSTPIAFSFVALIVILSAIFGTAFTPAAVDAFVVRQGLVLRSANTLYDTAMNIGYPIAEFVSNLFGIGPILPRDTSQIVAYQTLSNLVLKLDKYVNEFNENAQVFLASKGGVEAFRIELNRLCTQASQAAITAKNTSAYNGFLTKVSQLFQHLTSFETGGSIRQEPVVIYLYGQPNTGKSHMVTPIVELLSCLHRRKLTTWALGSTSKHFDGYTQQDVVVMDDPFVAEYMEENISRFIQLVSQNPYQTPMAELVEKGMTFTSKYIIVTTNTPGCAAVYSDFAAFNRRRHIFVEFPHRQEGVMLQGSRMTENFKWLNLSELSKKGSILPTEVLTAAHGLTNTMTEIVYAAFDLQNEFAQNLAERLDRAMGLQERIQNFVRLPTIPHNLPPLPDTDTDSDAESAEEQTKVVGRFGNYYFLHSHTIHPFVTTPDRYEFQLRGVRYGVDSTDFSLHAIKSSAEQLEEVNPELPLNIIGEMEVANMLHKVYFSLAGTPRSWDIVDETILKMDKKYFDGCPQFETTAIARASLANVGDFSTFTVPGGLSFVKFGNNVRRVLPIDPLRPIPLNDIHFYANDRCLGCQVVYEPNPFFLPYKGQQREFVCVNQLIVPEIERVGLCFGLFDYLYKQISDPRSNLLVIILIACATFVLVMSGAYLLSKLFCRAFVSVCPESHTFFNGYGFTSVNTGKAQQKKGSNIIELGDGVSLELDDEDQIYLETIKTAMERRPRTQQKTHVNEPRTLVTSSGELDMTRGAPVTERRGRAAKVARIQVNDPRPQITSNGDMELTPVGPSREATSSQVSSSRLDMTSVPPKAIFDQVSSIVEATSERRSRAARQHVSFNPISSLIPGSDNDTHSYSTPIHEATSETCRDEGALVLARLCYEKNTYDLVGYFPTTTVRNKCLMLRDNIGVSVKHTFTGAKKVMLIRNGEEMQVEVVYEVPNMDCVYFQVTDPTFPAARNITEHMRKRGEFEVLEQVPVLSIFKREELTRRGREYALVSVGVAKPNVYTTVRCSNFLSEGIAVTNRTLVDYSVDSQVSQAGDCGYPYVIMHTSISRKLLGIHFASNGVMGYMVPIYRDDVDKIAKIEGDVKDYPFHLSEAPQFIKDAYPDFDVRYEMCDRQGYLEKTFSPVKTRIHQSPLKTPLLPCDHEPAPLTAKDTRVTAPIQSIITQGIKKWTAPRQTNIDMTLLREVIQEMKLECYNILKKGNVFRVLTFDEAITGTRDIPFSSSLNMATSGGYRYNRHGNGKHAYFEWDQAGRYKLRNNAHGKQLKDYVGTAISLLKQSIVYPFVYLATVKDEVIKTRKIATGESRIFAAAPLDSVIIQRRYFGAAYWAFMAMRHSTPCKVGINPHSPEWKQLYQWMTRKSDIGFCCDYKNFDGSLPVEMLEGVCDIYCYLYERLDPRWTESDTILRKTFYKTVAAPLLGFSSVVVKAARGNPSGQVGTSIDNCLVNWMAFKYCYKRMQREAKYVGSFNEDVTLAVYGDDNIFTISPKIVPHFTFPKIKGFMAELGLEITPAEKDAETAKLEPVKSMTFLKRRFVCEGPAVLAQLEESSLGKIVHWCKGRPHEYWKTPDSINFDNDNLENTLLSLQMELTLYPDQFRNSIMEHIEECCERNGIELKPFNFFEVRNNISFGALLYGESKVILHSRVHNVKVKGLPSTY